MAHPLIATLGFLPSTLLLPRWKSSRAKSCRPVASPTAAASPANPAKNGANGVTSTRKKPGYWGDIANVERELREVNVALNRGGADVMPSTKEMRSLGRTDLISGLGRNGGIRAVMELLGWSFEDESSKKPGARQAGTKKAEAVGVTVAATGVTEGKGVSAATKRRGYWNEFRNVEAGLREVNVALNRSGEGVMPTTSEMKSLGRLDLLGGIKKHGGIKAVAKVLGWSHGNQKVNRIRVDEVASAQTPDGDTPGGDTDVKSAPTREPVNVWADWDFFAEKLLAFVAANKSVEDDSDYMPTARDLREVTDLLDGVDTHGGLLTVARKLGLTVRSAQNEGEDEDRIETRKEDQNEDRGEGQAKRWNRVQSLSFYLTDSQRRRDN